MIRFSLSLIAFLIFISSVHAQESSGLGGYVPPPLFGEPVVPESENRRPQDKMPSISPAPEPLITRPEKKENVETKPAVKTLLKGPVKTIEPVQAPQSKTNKPKAIPPAEKIKQAPEIIKPITPEKKLPKIEPAEKVKSTPVKPPKAVAPPKPAKKVIPIKKPVVKKPVKPGPEPIDLLRKKDIPLPPPLKDEGVQPVVKTEEPTFKPMPIPKKTSSEGVVKGPKTMPSVKKQSVESEVIFDPDKADKLDMIDRVQTIEDKEQQSFDKTKEEIEKIKSKIPAPKLEKQEDGSERAVMLYLEKQDEIKNAQINTLEQAIIPKLKANLEKKLTIQSFASAKDDSINSDRRMALSRGLAIRTYLISRGIQPNRLDVRALGAATNVQPIDRVELIIYE